MAITKLSSSRDYFRIWFFWKKHAISIFLFIIFLIMLYAYTVAPTYESKAEILVLPKTNEGAVITSGLEEKNIVPVSEKDIFTEVELIASHPVLKRTVENIGVKDIQLTNTKKSILKKIIQPIQMGLNRVLQLLKLTESTSSQLEKKIAALKNALIIEPIVDSNIISVAFQAEQPETTTKILKAILANYLKHRDTVFTKEEGLNFFQEQSVDYRTKLDEAEKNLKEFERAENILNLRIQTEANINLIAKLSNELKMLEISYEEQRSKIQMLKEKILKESSLLHLTKEMREIPAIRELEKGMVPLLIKRSEVSSFFTKTSRQYRAIHGQIEMLRDEIRREIEKAIRTDELELESLRIKIESLKNKIARLDQVANDFNQKEKMHQELSRKVELYKKSYMLYMGKTEEAKIFSRKTDKNIANVSISSEPSVPVQPISPNRLVLLILSVFAGTIAAFILPFILESIDNKMKTADDIEMLLELPVICSFNEIK